MKAISSFLFCVLSVSSSISLAAEISIPKTIPTHKRFLEQEQPQRLKETRPRKLNRAQDNQSPLPSLNTNEIHKRLEYKSDSLNHILPPAVISLERIYSELQTRALHYKIHNFERATELAQTGGAIKSLLSSISITLKNLKSKNYSDNQILLNASLAICGSGALLPEFNNITQTLSEAADTKDIDFNILKEAGQKIYQITQDIQVEGFTLSNE
ncbi:MAG: hypothetical protein K0M45_06860 [Candidatus Paracaedibacteraceae bacterium]|nr:hypothetical protein [Candidatus Paracaedibacteraceae bacterium]